LIDECTKLLLCSYRYNLEYLEKQLGINPEAAADEISKIVTELKDQIPLTTNQFRSSKLDQT
jgi:hypothetical protein